MALPNLSDVSAFKTAWDKLSPVPGGKALYSRMVSAFVPYTGSVSPLVEEMAPGRARVSIRDRRRLRNHLQSVHAIALANVAELAGNLALIAGMPKGSRFIVKGLSIDYLKKARGKITATATAPIPPSADKAEYDVAISLTDAGGSEVAKAVLKSVVGPVG